MLKKPALYIAGAAVLLIVITLVLVDRYFQWSKSDTLALQQLIIAVILLPTAIFGFIFTADAFRKTQTAPALDLRWQTKPGTYEKTLILQQHAGGGTIGSQGTIALVNTGNAIAVWYLVRISIPVWPRSSQLYTNFAIERWFGKTGESFNWQKELIDEETHVTFFSNGQIACYPGHPLVLGVVNLYVEPDVIYPDVSYITYTIQTDSNQAVHGKLEVRVETLS